MLPSCSDPQDSPRRTTGHPASALSSLYLVLSLAELQFPSPRDHPWVAVLAVFQSGNHILWNRLLWLPSPGPLEGAAEGWHRCHQQMSFGRWGRGRRPSPRVKSGWIRERGGTVKALTACWDRSSHPREGRAKPRDREQTQLLSRSVPSPTPWASPPPPLKGQSLPL